MMGAAFFVSAGSPSLVLDTENAPPLQTGFHPPYPLYCRGPNRLRARFYSGNWKVWFKAWDKGMDWR